MGVYCEMLADDLVVVMMVADMKTKHESSHLFEEVNI